MNINSNQCSVHTYVRMYRACMTLGIVALYWAQTTGLSKANFSNKKKVMELERGNRELTAQLELARAQIQDAKGRLETCERLQKRDNIAFQD